MSSGKTLQLMQIAHDYEQNGLYPYIAKPSKDGKGGSSIVTRLGNISRECDLLIGDKTDIYEEVTKMRFKPDVILIDEGQFLNREHVWQLVELAKAEDIPVLVFCLRSDFLGNPFEGSTYLFAVADKIEETNTRALDPVANSGKVATMNMRLVNGKPTFEGSQIAIDGTDSVEYVPVTMDTFLYHRNVWEIEEKKKKEIAREIDTRGGLIGNGY